MTCEEIVKTLDTLSNDELETILDHAEEILRKRLEKVPFEELPFFGMWADRDDMQDSAAWVRRLRGHHD